MTTPNKGSRLVVVDGQSYRWRVRHQPTYHQANGWSPLTFSVERAEEPGTTLVVVLPGVRPDSWLGEPIVGAVLPREVARLIRAARTAGWQPSERAKPFLFDAGEAA